MGTPAPGRSLLIRPDGTGLKRITEHGNFCGSPKWQRDSRRVIAYCMTAEQTLANRRASPSPETTPGCLVRHRRRRIGGCRGRARREDQSVGAEGHGRIHPEGRRRRRWYLLHERHARTEGRCADRRVVSRRRARRFPQAADVAAPAWRRTWSRNPAYELTLTAALPSFSPSGDRFAIDRAARRRRFGAGVAVATPGAETSTVIYQDKARNVLAPQWSPGGDTIIFGIGVFNAFFNGFNGLFLKPGDRVESGAQIAMIRPDGSGFRELTSGANNNGFPSMAPDGKRFVYRSFGPEGDGLRIKNLETGAVTALTTGYDNFPLWSPRGDLIMFSRQADGDYEIYSINPDGTGVKRLTVARGQRCPPGVVAGRRAHRVRDNAHGVQGRDDVYGCAAAVRRDFRDARTTGRTSSSSPTISGRKARRRGSPRGRCSRNESGARVESRLTPANRDDRSGGPTPQSPEEPSCPRSSSPTPSPIPHTGPASTRSVSRHSRRGDQRRGLPQPRWWQDGGRRRRRPRHGRDAGRADLARDRGREEGARGRQSDHDAGREELTPVPGADEHLISRRRALALFGAGALAPLGACGGPAPAPGSLTQASAAGSLPVVPPAAGRGAALPEPAGDRAAHRRAANLAGHGHRAHARTHRQVRRAPQELRHRDGHAGPGRRSRGRAGDRGRTISRTVARRTRGGEGPLLHEGRADDGRDAGAEEFRARRGRHGGREAADRGRGDPRQAESHRRRDGRLSTRTWAFPSIHGTRRCGQGCRPADRASPPRRVFAMRQSGPTPAVRSAFRPAPTVSSG